MTALADDLLEAHVQHDLAHLRDALGEQVDEAVHALFTWFGSMTLAEVTSEEVVLGIIERCVIDLPVSGGVIELTGEVARLVFSSLASSETRLSEVVEDEAYEGFAEKIAKLERARQELLSVVARSEAFGAIIAEMVSRALPELLLGPRTAAPLVKKALPPIERRLRSIVAKQLERERARAGQQQQDRLLEALDPEYLRSLADEIWSSVSSLRLSDVFQLIQEDDLEDFVVLGHEFWLRYRRTPYFRRVSTEVVAHVFAKYGHQTLAFVIEDMGVTERVAARELRALLNPLFAAAERSGFLQTSIRARLTPFYESARFRELLAQHDAGAEPLAKGK